MTHGRQRMKGAVAVCLCLLVAQAARAQDPQWFATWTLDRAKSHLVGPSITIGRIPHGYHFDFGAVSFNVGDDGKDYPTVPNRTTIIRPVGPNVWERTHKIDGKEVDHGTLTVTPDGKRMLIHTVATETDGTKHVSDETLLREGAGTGLEGTWRSTDAGVTVSQSIQLTSAGDGRIRWAYPDDGQFYVIRPNGPAVPLEGPRSVPGVTVLLRQDSAREMSWTESVNGKPYTEGRDQLSADGKTLTETTWQAGPHPDRQQAVYTRQ